MVVLREHLWDSGAVRHAQIGVPVPSPSFLVASCALWEAVGDGSACLRMEPSS